MKDPREWDEEYLLNLPVGEFDWLEVKGRRGLDLTLPKVNEADIRENLSKAISAFANSGGGIIVFGLENPQNAWQIDDGGIELIIKKPSTREWLEDVIPTLIELPLPSFNVYVIQGKSDASQIVTGRGIFVIEIPDSDQAPHQAIDKRYYARVGGKSRPIGHLLVTDIFGRRQLPKIQLEFDIEMSNYIDQGLFPPVSSSLLGQNLNNEPEKKTKFELIVSARNTGRVFAKYVNSFVYIPIILIPDWEQEPLYDEQDFEEIDGTKYMVWSRLNTQRDLVKVEPFGGGQYGSSWFDPILPGLAFIWEWELSEKFNKIKLGDLKILWEVYADNAPKQNGSILVREIDVITNTDKS
jgi:hypothetical protein